MPQAPLETDLRAGGILIKILRAVTINSTPPRVAFDWADEATGIEYRDWKLLARRKDGALFIAPPERDYVANDGTTKYRKYVRLPDSYKDKILEVLIAHLEEQKRIDKEATENPFG